jgi:hypothetical protein
MPSAAKEPEFVEQVLAVQVALEFIFAVPVGPTTPGRPRVVGLFVPVEVVAERVGQVALSAPAQPVEEKAPVVPKRPAMFGVEAAWAPVTTPAWHGPNDWVQAVEASARLVPTGSLFVAFAGSFEPLRTACSAAAAPPSGLAAEVELPVTVPAQPWGQSRVEPACVVPATPGIQVAFLPLTGGVARPVLAVVAARASEPVPHPFAPRQLPAEWETLRAASPAPLVEASLAVVAVQPVPAHCAPALDVLWVAGASVTGFFASAAASRAALRAAVAAVAAALAFLMSCAVAPGRAATCCACSATLPAWVACWASSAASSLRCAAITSATT